MTLKDGDLQRRFFYRKPEAFKHVDTGRVVEVVAFQAEGYDRIIDALKELIELRARVCEWELLQPTDEEIECAARAMYHVSWPSAPDWSEAGPGARIGCWTLAEAALVASREYRTRGSQ